ncbi:hypothetical protein ABEB36_000849 [Hypothenemus hampei]|uniref:Oligopeptide transporter 1 n=1 Tax=Hypothenemus hampei TaxID=57062 RepID=A0ABD1FF93_HYPHA
MYLDSTYPTAVFCIIATEFCERFSFCGLRTILSLYLRNILLFNEDAATVIYHVFIMVCYIVPLIGAICADSFLGRYRTIRNFSLIYLAGNILMCIAAVPVLDHNPILMSIVGLLLIAIGTGGLKPCVAAFGAEQFRLPEQKDLLRYFFSIFYFTINLGGFVGMIVTPIIRKTVYCFGDDTCYALGFGFPALLMLLSILLFLLGKQFYKLKSPKRNVMLEFVKCSWYAIIERCASSKEPNKDHWLDYAKDKFDWKLIQDMKVVFAILLLFVPLPIFWSLFDQQGSRWTFQASHMDCNILGVQIIPDQMQVINPAIVMILIPLFDKLLYPYLEKAHLLTNSLHRMTIGGLTAGLAFVGAGVLELVLEKNYPDLPGRHQGSLNVVNTLPCSLMLSNPVGAIEVLGAANILRMDHIKCYNTSSYELIIEAPLQCGSIQFRKEQFKLTTVLNEHEEDTFIIGVNQQQEINGYITDPIDFQKSITGSPKFRIDYVKNTNILQNISVTLHSSSGLQDIYFLGVHSNATALIVSPYIEVSQGVYECKIRSETDNNLFEKHFHFALGGIYSLIIRENYGEIKFVKLYAMADPNSVNILWQIPQYLLISIAEIMFGVAGLEFSFTQAPKSMKTVTIAGWYLSTAVGNFLVILVTQLDLFKSQAHEFFLFALLIVVDMMMFIEMACRYRFVQLEVESSAFIMMDPIDVPLLDVSDGSD